jgi:hypothetical protein
MAVPFCLIAQCRRATGLERYPLTISAALLQLSTVALHLAGDAEGTTPCAHVAGRRRIAGHQQIPAPPVDAAPVECVLIAGVFIRSALGQHAPTLETPTQHSVGFVGTAELWRFAGLHWFPAVETRRTAQQLGAFAVVRVRRTHFWHAARLLLADRGLAKRWGRADAEQLPLVIGAAATKLLFVTLELARCAGPTQTRLGAAQVHR